MKKLVFTTILTTIGVLGLFAQAPSYVDFEWDILRLGYASPNGVDSLDSGFTLGMELRYNLTDDLSIGLSSDVALFGSDFDSDDVDISWSGSNSLSLDKYFSKTSGYRAFAGAGIGYYRSGETKIRNGEEESTIQGESSFGVSPRIGYELGHVRFMAQYHHTFKSEVSNFISITAALTLWGGYKG